MIEEELTLLVRTRNVLKQGWTQGVYARDANGDVVSPIDSKASQWCLSGALRKAAGISLVAKNPIQESFRKAYIAIMERCHNSDIVSFNDANGRTQEDILEFMDLVISQRETKMENPS